MNKQITFNAVKTDLTDFDIDQIVKIVGTKCRIKTKNRLRSILTYSSSSLPNFGIFDRLIVDEDSKQWTYIAGQSYPDEIKTLRDCILGRIY